MSDELFSTANFEEFEIDERSSGSFDYQPAARRTAQELASSLPLYIDLETIPDFGRCDLFPLSYDEYPARMPRNQCPDLMDTLSKGLQEMEAFLMQFRPSDEYLEILVRMEENQKKPRLTAAEMIRRVQRKLAEQDSSYETYIKQLSITPEYCRICAMGWAVGESDIFSMVVGTDEDTELNIVRQFWHLASVHNPIVTYNGLRFDIPVLQVRTALLGQRGGVLDIRPWSNKVVDVWQRRFGGGAPKQLPTDMKSWAQICGIKIPAGEMSGADVFATYESDPEKIHNYVRSDVFVLRELHHMFRGILF